MKQKPAITKLEFISKELKDISQVYSGERDCCRCGCRGTYTATSFMENPHSDVNNKLIEKRLKRCKQLVLDGAQFDSGDTYVDVTTGNNRSMCFYFDDLKKTKK